jgi:hypothetical protein
MRSACRNLVACRKAALGREVAYILEAAERLVGLKVLQAHFFKVGIAAENEGELQNASIGW